MKKVDKRQEHFNGKSPVFIMPSGRSIRARFLEVSHEVIVFTANDLSSEELVSRVAEQLVEELTLNYLKILLDSDLSFTQRFNLNIEGNTFITVAVLSLLEEGFYYYLRLDKIM